MVEYLCQIRYHSVLSIIGFPESQLTIADPYGLCCRWVVKRTVYYCYHTVFQMRSLWILVTAALCLSLSLADDDSARLLASKHVLNMMLVQEKDITIEYEIFNVGGR